MQQKTVQSAPGQLPPVHARVVAEGHGVPPFAGFTVMTGVADWVHDEPHVP